jgi:hypothetical protein
MPPDAGLGFAAGAIGGTPPPGATARCNDGTYSFPQTRFRDVLASRRGCGMADSVHVNRVYNDGYFGCDNGAARPYEFRPTLLAIVVDRSDPRGTLHPQHPFDVDLAHLFHLRAGILAPGERQRGACLLTSLADELPVQEKSLVDHRSDFFRHRPRAALGGSRLDPAPDP